jgi:dihydroflavonol-4-reductase
MKIAVTGATGFIGSHLVECLLARGHEVSCLVRDPARLGWIEGIPVRAVRGDLDSPAALADLVEGQDVVVHSAGITKAKGFDQFVRVNVEGSAKVVEAVHARGRGVKRLVYFSSQAAMGPSSGRAALAEDAAQRPVSLYGKSKSMAEARIRDSCGSLPVTVIRPPAVYGPRDRDVLTFFRLVRGGLAPVLAGERLVSVVYVKNLVQGIALAIESPLGGWRSYSFTDGGEPSWAGLLDSMARALGSRPLRVRVPLAAAALATGASECWAAVLGRPALLSWGKLAEMRPRYNLVSDERARTELGYRPAVSTDRGIEETVLWYREQGWL